MKTITNVSIGITILFALAACDPRRPPAENKGGDGSDTFVPNVDAARARDVSELKKRRRSPEYQDQKKPQSPTPN